MEGGTNLGERRIMIRIPQELWKEVELVRTKLGERLGFRLSINDLILHQLRRAVDEVAKDQAAESPGRGLKATGR
jgi:hypothetical protein